MPKVIIKDVIMFLKIFVVSSLFFIEGIIICFIGEKTIGISWPEYVIFSAILIGDVIIVLIIEKIRFIKIHKKNKSNIALKMLLKNKTQNKEGCYKWDYYQQKIN